MLCAGSSSMCVQMCVCMCVNIAHSGSVPSRGGVTSQPRTIMSPTSHDLAACLRNFPLASRSGASTCRALYVFRSACVHACMCMCTHERVCVVAECFSPLLHLHRYQNQHLPLQAQASIWVWCFFVCVYGYIYIYVWALRALSRWYSVVHACKMSLTWLHFAHLAALTGMNSIVEAWCFIWADPALQAEGAEVLLGVWRCSTHPWRRTGGGGQGV